MCLLTVCHQQVQLQNTDNNVYIMIVTIRFSIFMATELFLRLHYNIHYIIIIENYIIGIHCLGKCIQRIKCHPINNIFSSEHPLVGGSCYYQWYQTFMLVTGASVRIVALTFIQRQGKGVHVPPPPPFRLKFYKQEYAKW